MRVFLTLLLLAAAALLTVNGDYEGHVVFRSFYSNQNAANTETPFEGTAVVSQNITDGAFNTTVTLSIRGLRANKTYGVHVHQWGDLSGAINPADLTLRQNITTVTTIGGHFDMFGRNNDAHGCRGNPMNQTRHTGDVGNITIPADTDVTQFQTYTLQSELLDLGADNIANNSIIGRAIVIHELPDICWVPPSPGLGAWVGVGVIGIANPSVLFNEATQDPELPIDHSQKTPKANALLYNTTGGFSGNVWFWTDASNNTHMSGFVRGFAPDSIHAVQIHQYGTVTDSPSLGAIYGNGTHALPLNGAREWGILGNLIANENGEIIFNDISYGLELISLQSVARHSIIGRSIAFHEKAENGTVESSGLPVVFGVIGLAGHPANSVPSFPVNPNTAPGYAHAVLRAYYNSNNNVTYPDINVAGTVDFQQAAYGVGDVNVTIRLSGLRPGTYGVHVHQWGDLSAAIDPMTGLIRRNMPTVTTVGGHFDVLQRNNAWHGCRGNPNNQTRHTGDVGNIIVTTTNATEIVSYALSSELLDLGIRNEWMNDSIIGRAVIIHEFSDNCWVPPAPGLGGWVALGVIGLNNIKYGNSAKQDILLPTIKANVLVLNATTKVPLGDIQFTTDSNGMIRAIGAVGGFAANSLHGMHVHVWGNEDSAAASGPHFSQYLADYGHGLPPSSNRHWGALGNVTANSQGFIVFDNVTINADLLSLWNATANGIIGRILTFHQNNDNGDPSSYGARVAYGVIGLASSSATPPSLPTQPASSTGSSSSGSSSSSSGSSSSITGTGTGTGTGSSSTSATVGPTPGGPNGTSSSTGGTQPPTTAPTNPPSAANHHQANMLVAIAYTAVAIIMAGL